MRFTECVDTLVHQWQRIGVLYYRGVNFSVVDTKEKINILLGYKENCDGPSQITSFMITAASFLSIYVRWSSRFFGHARSIADLKGLTSGLKSILISMTFILRSCPDQLC